MIELELRVDEPLWETIDGLEGMVVKALNAGAGVAERAGQVSVLLTEDEAMQTLNRDFRGKNKPTDVLSFPAAEIEAPFLGDICVAHGVASSDAHTGNKTLSDHLSHLLIHGFLHLLGHDHEEDTEAEKMEALEINALASIGIANPYI